MKISGALTKVRMIGKQLPTTFQQMPPRYPLCYFHLYSNTDSECTSYHNVTREPERSLTESSDYVSTLRDPNEVWP